MTPIKNMYKLAVKSERLAAAQAKLHFRSCERAK